MDDTAVGTLENGYPEALINASRLSMKTGRVLWLYQDALFYYVTDSYKGKFLAKCYPGGRVIDRIGAYGMPALWRKNSSRELLSRKVVEE